MFFYQKCNFFLSLNYSQGKFMILWDSYGILLTVLYIHIFFYIVNVFILNVCAYLKVLLLCIYAFKNNFAYIISKPNQRGIT